MGAITEEVWQWLWSYRDWLIAIVVSDYGNIVGRDQNKACDLADDVLLRAAQNIQQLRDRRKLKSWLRKILANAATDLWGGRQHEGESFAQWLSAVNENQQDGQPYRYFAFLSLLELQATKAEKRYIATLKKDATATKVVNIPKRRAVQLLKKRFHSTGKDDAAEQAKLAQSSYQGMVDVSAFAKQITANIAAIFKSTVRSVNVPDDVIWEWCCAMVIAEMRAGLIEVRDEAKADKSVNEAAAEATDEIFKFALKLVLAEAVANTPGL